MENLEFEIPKGYVIDKAKSTKTKLVYVQKEVKITEHIQSLEDAIEYIGKADEDVITYRKMISVGITGHASLYMELIIITKALNEKWIPNWDDINECKWWLWWNMTTSGFGVSHAGYGSWGSTTDVGSRLVFKSEEIALHASKQFLGKFKEYLIIKKSY